MSVMWGNNIRCTESQIQRFRVAMIGNKDPWKAFVSPGTGNSGAKYL